MKRSITYGKYLPGDFGDYYDLVKSDRVMQYITGSGLSAAAARATFDRFLETNRLHPSLGYFKVMDAQTGARIGECKLVGYGTDGSAFEIGYLLKEDRWGLGYGTLICEAMLSLASAVGPEKDVVAIIDPANTASRRLLEKFGFISFFVGQEDGVPTEKLVRRP